MTIRGQPMIYGFTIPEEADNQEIAIEFAKYMLKWDGGIRILENLGQKAIKFQFSPESIENPDLFE